MDEDRVQIACVYGKGNQRGAEYLLGGVRTLILRNWDDSMTTNEFYHIGMIPLPIVNQLKERYNPTDLLEITRLCLRRGHVYEPKWGVIRHSITRFNMEVARDLAYATVYALAEKTGRKRALLIVDRYYLRVMQRSHFVFEELYSHPQGGRRGYSLTVLDLHATIFAIEDAGAYDRVRRMLSLCTQPIIQ
jgi:hypothetical protein